MVLRKYHDFTHDLLRPKSDRYVEPSSPCGLRAGLAQPYVALKLATAETLGMRYCGLL
jgi:hypothetical protein